MQVQYEGYELLRELIHRPNCQEPILMTLVTVLRTVFETSNEDGNHRTNKETKPGNVGQWNSMSTEDQKEKEKLLSGYVQQAYAAKLIG